MSDNDFEKLCAVDSNLRFEMDSDGQVNLNPFVDPISSHRRFNLIGRVGSWIEATHIGVGADGSACFTLPNGAKRSPSLSWIRQDRWDALTPRQRNEFTHICPDFVIELRSKTDRLKPLQNKMSEYIENGAQLGWLIDPSQGKVHIYRPDKAVEILEQPTEISGEEVLPGFMLKLAGILD